MSPPAALELHLTDAERDLYDRTRALASGTLAPIAGDGPAGRVNRPLVRALAEHGLLARLFADGSADGEDVTAIELCLIREALARGCTEAETAFALLGLGAHPILQAGGDAVRER